MTREQLDAMQAAAMRRLVEYINRAAAQHLRAMRERGGGGGEKSTHISRARAHLGDA